jgi:hypothetical protein
MLALKYLRPSDDDLLPGTLICDRYREVLYRESLTANRNAAI